MREIRKKAKAAAAIILIALGIFVLREIIAIKTGVAVGGFIINVVPLNNNLFWGAVVWIFLKDLPGVLLSSIGTGMFCAKYFLKRANRYGVGIVALSFVFYFVALSFGGLTMSDLSSTVMCFSQGSLLACGVFGVFLGNKLVVSRIKRVPEIPVENV